MQQLMDLSGYNEKMGTTLLGLKKAAEAEGLHAVGMKIGIDELLNCKVLSIAYRWGSHFSVVESSLPNEVKVTDPPGDPKVVPLEEFEKTYSGFALLVAKDQTGFPKPVANGPDLRFDAYDYDFGFIEEGAQVGRTFAYHNEGNEELVIASADTSCSCAQAFLREARRVSPGGMGVLVVGFDSTGKQGKLSETIYVHSNDSISPVVHLVIGGTVKPARVAVSRTNLFFGTVGRMDSAVREVYVPDPGDGSLLVKDVSSDSPFIRVSLARRADKQQLVYVIRAALQPGAPIGALKGKITVSTNHPKEPVVEIPVVATVIGDIQAFPDQFFLGLLKKGQSTNKSVTLSTNAKQPFTIGKIDSPFDYVVVTAQPDIQGKKYNITAAIQETAPIGMTKGEVVVHTSNRDQPEIRIPLYALVQGD